MSSLPTDLLPQRVPNPVRTSEAPQPTYESVEEKALRLARGGASDDDIRIVCGLNRKQMKRLQKSIDRCRREYRVRLRTRLMQMALEGKVPALKALLGEDVKFPQQEAEDIDLPDVPAEWG
jgi:hypothetical protein